MAKVTWLNPATSGVIAKADANDQLPMRISTEPRKATIFDIPFNSCHVRVLQALSVKPRRREEIDKLGGVSNGPALVAQLRRLGLAIPCERLPSTNRDGKRVQYGVYSLSHEDRIALSSLRIHWERG